MNVLRKDRSNSFHDLRGHGLYGSPYRWVFRAEPSLGSSVVLHISLKELGVFGKVLLRSNVTLSSHDSDNVSVITRHLDQLLINMEDSLNASDR